jgi:hypothetical protein
MDKPNVFESRLAAGLEAVAGSRRGVDAVSIARAAVSRSNRRPAPRWRPGLVPNRVLVVGLVAIVGVAVIVAGAALLQLPTVQLTAPAPTSSLAPVPTELRQSGWTSTGSMREGRYLATATVLPDGRVLVTGGDTAPSGPSLRSTELYDPTGRVWVDGPSMGARRAASTATRLADGRVLVAGGFDAYDATTTVEIFDPATRTWTGTGPMGEPRGDHTATLLPDGTVLVAGGRHKRSSTGFALASAEVYDPATGNWHSVADMERGRVFHTATLLPDGRVLIAGAGLKAMRFDLGVTAELYDPLTGLWTATSAMLAGRGHHAATPLQDGRVLVFGGNEPYKGPLHVDGWEAPLASAELYDPLTDQWTATAGMSQPRTMFAAAIVGNDVIIVGSEAGRDTPPERYDVTTGGWSTVDGVFEGRESPLGVALLGGAVLVAGGWSGARALPSAEVYVFPN